MPRQVGRRGSQVKTIKPDKTIIPPKFDKSKTLAFGGIIGLIITYFIFSRALDTGSYWEYLFTVIFILISIRLFIRSIQKM